MEKINLERAKSLVLAEIEKEGVDYVYDASEGCSNYNEDGTPSCLVGRALDAGGYISYEQVKGTPGVYSSIAELADILDLYLTPQAYIFLSSLQCEQDSGYTWGDSYTYASAKAENPRLIEMHSGPGPQ